MRTLFRLFKIVFIILLSYIFLFVIYFFMVANPVIEEELKLQNGLIFRYKEPDQQYLYNLTGIDHIRHIQDITQPPSINGGPYMRCLLFDLEEKELPSVVQKLQLRKEESVPLQSFINLTNTQNIKWMHLDSNQLSNWESYQQEYLKEDLFTLIEGFEIDKRGCSRYEISLFYNRNLHQCIIIISLLP